MFICFSHCILLGFRHQGPSAGVKPKCRNTTQHNTHNTTQHNTHNTTQHNTHNTTQHTQHNTTQHHQLTCCDRARRFKYPLLLHKCDGSWHAVSWEQTTYLTKVSTLYKPHMLWPGIELGPRGVLWCSPHHKRLASTWHCTFSDKRAGLQQCAVCWPATLINAE